MGNLLGTLGTIGSVASSIADPITAVAGAVGALGSLFGLGGSSEPDYKKQYKYQSKFYQEQRQGNMEDWFTQLNYTNFYNSPEQTMKRLMEAGMNPNLAYENAQGWHTAATPQIGGKSSLSLQSTLGQKAAMMNAFQNMALAASQAKKNEADANLANTRAKRESGQEEREADMHEVQKEYTQNLAKYYEDQSSYLKAKEKIEKDMSEAEIKHMEEQNNEISARIARMEAQTKNEEKQIEENKRHNIAMERTAAIQAKASLIGAHAAMKQANAYAQQVDKHIVFLEENTKQLRDKHQLYFKDNFINISIPKFVEKQLKGTEIEKFIVSSKSGAKSIKMSYAAYMLINNATNNKLQNEIKRMNYFMSRSDLKSYDIDKQLQRIGTLINAGAKVAGTAIGVSQLQSINSSSDIYSGMLSQQTPMNNIYY